MPRSDTARKMPRTASDKSIQNPSGLPAGYTEEADGNDDFSIEDKKESVCSWIQSAFDKTSASQRQLAERTFPRLVEGYHEQYEVKKNATWRVVSNGQLQPSRSQSNTRRVYDFLLEPAPGRDTSFLFMAWTSFLALSDKLADVVSSLQPGQAIKPATLRALGFEAATSREGGVYVLFFPGGEFYVGWTSCFEVRLDDHQTYILKGNNKELRELKKDKTWEPLGLFVVRPDTPGTVGHIYETMVMALTRATLQPGANAYIFDNNFYKMTTTLSPALVLSFLDAVWKLVQGGVLIPGKPGPTNDFADRWAAILGDEYPMIAPSYMWTLVRGLRRSVLVDCHRRKYPIGPHQWEGTMPKVIGAKRVRAKERAEQEITRRVARGATKEDMWSEAQHWLGPGIKKPRL